ncbi:MAG: hypothetical protein KZQ74_15340 [gamma proteobacterium symbiont of Bathyaustriella thionipta]|nr:hypothetical protein [gamma proteobacterium symbiont of Bathyaustriella thionipta]MCU7958390.1 hypothetical protein [gamma proteobacterium symbiont of Bathyaustriella thionipta]MCU7968538.1 hypothetical protein [gamma proteobacterium symbiont of Bathyaustriella thionipta]
MKSAEKCIYNKYHYIIKIVLTLFLLSSGSSLADNEHKKFLELDKDGIKVHFFSHDNFGFGTFKATTHLNTSLASILSVMFDHESCHQWVYSCIHSYVIKDISFNQRYHYQILYIPFPFKDREFIFYSTLKQDSATKIITITTKAVMNDCQHNNFYLCNHPKEPGHVKVNVSIGLFILEPTNKGVQFTWMQHTNPGGNLPSWLVNQFIEDMPYWTLKNLSRKVEEKPYKYAKLVYNQSGLAIALEVEQHDDRKLIQRTTYNH